jgi:hypothetical protein
VNLDKTEGFSLNCEPIKELGIKWNPESFKYLGIILCRDTKKAHRLNIDKAVKTFKMSLQAWSHRKLTFRGKITIVNTGALSKILHILTPLYVPNETFEELNRLARNFLWNSQTSKISFNNIIQPTENGGLKFPNPEFRIKSLKLSWIKKAFNNCNEIWVESFRNDLNLPIDLVSKGSQNNCKSKNLFIKQLFDIWDKASHLFLPSTPEQTVNESLWQNPNILYNKRTIYLRNWYSAGIKTLGDFWNFRTRDFKTKRELGNIQLLTDFQYNKVIQATSKFKDMLKNANPDQVINEPFVKTKKNHSFK